MHIADECGAFRLLTEEGKSIAHISALFKVSEMVVRRALKIANLSPVLLDLLRDDKLDYEQAKVLALADDYATQERVWNDAQTPWLRRPAELRAALTKAELDARENREVPKHVTYGHWEDDEESDADSTQDECNDGDAEEAEAA